GHIQTSRREFHDVGYDRFLVDVDFETKIIATGAVLKGGFLNRLSATQPYAFKKGLGSSRQSNVSEYGPIYEAIQKRNIDGFNKGNANFIEEMFDEHAVVVDKTNNRSHNGLNQIKLMIEGFLQTGKIEFKMPRRVFHDLGGDRFLVDVDYETTIVATGAVIK
ncbi:hypothetical protein PMAYCL1PPCAC_22185, partial [Pristionchus mayeri]